MLHAPEWIVAWRLKQAYSLTETDILSLVQGLGEKGHVSLHFAWGEFQSCFLQPQVAALPQYWRSAAQDIPAKTSPSWIARAFTERDNLYETLRIVSVHADKERLIDDVTGKTYTTTGEVVDAKRMDRDRTVSLCWQP